jgi:uncharacterized heparinase superfamily protein
MVQKSRELTRFKIERTVKTATGKLSVPAIALAGLLGSKPTRLLIAPQDLRSADPTIADDLYAGHYAFGGQIVDARGFSPFELEPPTEAWGAGLYGFGWLRHLRAADTPLAKAHAQSLVRDFLRLKPAFPIVNAIQVVNRRLTAMVSHSPIVLEKADHSFYHRYVRSIYDHTRILRHRLAHEPDGLTRLQSAIALCYAAVALDKPTGLLHRAVRFLSEELDKQILPDGGHIGRNPMRAVEIVLDLLPLRQSLAVRGIAIPAEISGAVERMMPMVRMMRHGDGSVALFNGVGVTQRNALARIIAYDETRESLPENASQSGYSRVLHGNSLLIADTGTLPPINYAGECHAGCLSFEFSSGSRPMIVNCGAPVLGDTRLRNMARSTAAHSTLVLGDTSSARLSGETDASGMRYMMLGPTHVTLDRQQIGASTMLRAAHNGYAQNFGLIHERLWTMSHDGTALHGADRLSLAAKGQVTPPAGLMAAIRFHLHPSIVIRHREDGFDLELSETETWHFSSQTHGPELEDSVFFAAAEGMKRSTQIVLVFEARPDQLCEWCLEKRLHV